MRKLTLLPALLLAGALLASAAQAQTFRFKSAPHVPIYAGQTVIDRIYVPTDVKMANVRIGLYCKTVYFGSLRIVLTAPKGNQVVLKNETAYGTQWEGSLGSDRSWALFQDGGNAISSTAIPNDWPIQPAQPLVNLTSKDAQGWWTITVMDTRNNTAPYQTGFLEGWSVNFNSVVREPEAVLWSQIKTGSQLVGQLNGVSQIIPNELNGLALCTMTGIPNVIPGKNGDSYPFIISGLGYPGLLIGDPVPGYATPGRFRVRVDVACSHPGLGAWPAAPTGDIAIYFGKSPAFNPPLQSPPSPPNTVGTSSQWPTGSGGWTNQLLGGNALQGGVRLSACNAEDATPWPIPWGDVGGYSDCLFDDRAFYPITSADLCGGPLGSGVCGDFKPEMPLSGLNGLPVEGLYYVSVYDTYGDSPMGVYGQVRVLRLVVEYLAGGGDTENPDLHQGITGPLHGVPVPGRIQGLSLGFLSDVITTVPPYSIHAKDQDPLLFLWGVQKMGPRNANGYENLIARQGTSFTYIASDGPYAYPGALDANPMVAGLSANSDLGFLPVGSFYLRSQLSQQRYDDDNTDNWYETQNPLQVTPTTLAYYGEQVIQWNDYQEPGQNGIFSSLPFQPIGSPASGIGQTFMLWKFPYTSVTSIDYKIDKGNVVSQTWRTPLRISIWRLSGAMGYFGAPVGPPVAKSKTINAEEYMLGNWRSFPIYQCNQNGDIMTTSPTVNLAPGAYVVCLDNMSTTNVILYPYTWGMLPYMTDRNWVYKFNEEFGPLGPYALLGTRFMYQYNSGGVAPPSAGMSALATPSPWSNLCLPMRLNMTNLNDFAIDYMTINGTKGTEAVSMTTAPFQPNVVVTANSLQGNQTKDFNVRLEIFDPGNTRVYLHDRNYGPGGAPPAAGITGYETVSVPMAQWNPAYGGMYRVKAFFSRKPDDQNPVNDEHEYWLFVSSTNAVLATGSGATASDINSAISALRDKGVTAEVMEASDPRIAAARGLDIYLLGLPQGDAKEVMTQAIANGNNIGIVYDRKANAGQLLRVIDNVFDVTRPNANYDKITLFPKLAGGVEDTRVIEAPEIEINSREDVVAYIKSNRPNVEPVMQDPVETKIDPEVVEQMIPVATDSPYGELLMVDQDLGDIGIMFVTPSNRKSGAVTTEATAPEGFVLEQNYPNPFNPTTTITYTLPQNSIVTLRVLDMLGREVMTLVSGAQEAGRYSTTWNGLNLKGENVSSGSYMYRLDATPAGSTETYTSIRKMTLSK